MERKGKWWREYTKQQVEDGKEQEPPARTVQRKLSSGRVPTATMPNARVFQIKIVPGAPTQVQQARQNPQKPQKLPPYQRLRAWFHRNFSKAVFGAAVLVAGYFLKRKTGRR